MNSKYMKADKELLHNGLVLNFSWNKAVSTSIQTDTPDPTVPLTLPFSLLGRISGSNLVSF